jgi:hypothetical protein
MDRSHSTDVETFPGRDRDVASLLGHRSEHQ